MTPSKPLTTPSDDEPDARTSREEDLELIRRAREGDTDAYDRLVLKYRDRIYALAYNMTSNRHDAEDLVQDAFVRAYRSLGKFRGQSSFYTWIYRIAVNRAINFLKKRKRRQAPSLDDVDGGIERDPAFVELSARITPRREVNLNELQKKLNEALQKLSEKHRTVVVLHDIQGIPHEQISRMVGVSEGTVRSRLFYARKQLQGELAEYTKRP